MDLPPVNEDRRGPRSIEGWVTIIALVINLAGIVWVTAQQNTKTDIILSEVRDFQSHQANMLSALVDKVNGNTVNLAVINAELQKGK